MNKILCFILLSYSAWGFSQTGLPQNIIIDGSYGINSPQEMKLNDLNNDNITDILVSGSARDLYWIKSLGNGSFNHAELIYRTPVNDIKEYDSADFDGDGKTDIIFSANNGLFLLKGTGNSASPFSAPVVLSNQNISLFRIADIDGDGDMDIYLHQPLYGLWLKNNGNATFTTGGYIFTSLQKPNSVILRDLDNDNKPDLLVRTTESRILRWYKNDGNGNFYPQQVIDNYTLGDKFNLGDIDGDGDLDIVYLYENGLTKEFQWYKNTDGQGNFSVSQTISPLPYDPGTTFFAEKRFGLKLLDVDGDAKQDLVFSLYWEKKLLWKKNLGNGTFGPHQMITGNANMIFGFDSADFNNDSKMDLISASFFDDKIAWYENLNNTAFSSEKILTTNVNSVSEIAAQDIDGDGDLDVIAVSDKNKISWFKNVDGNFSTPQKIISEDFAIPTQLRMFDADGDGDLDIFVRGEVGTPTTYRYAWLENDGNTNFNTVHEIINVGTNPLYAIIVEDLNGDGKKDFAFLTQGDQLKIMFNSGNGNFLMPVIFSNVINSPVRYFKTIDMDNDGDQDIVTRYSSSEFRWYENQNGSFTVTHTLPIPVIANDPYVDLVDLDGDGDRDLYYSNQYGNEIAWSENMGQSTFSAKKPIGQGQITRPISYLLMDMDNDGLRDLVVNSESQPRIRWFKNNGNGNYDANPQVVTTNIGSISQMRAADLNGDGIPELLASSSHNTLDNYKLNMISWFGTVQGSLGISDLTKDKSAIYPNPTDGILHLDIKDGPETIEVYNMLGQRVKLYKNVKTIDISEMPAGIYILRIASKNKASIAESFKVIKK